MSKKLRYILLLFTLLTAVVFSCKKQEKTIPDTSGQIESTIRYATGFNLKKYDGYTVIEVKSPWPGAKKMYRYALVPKEKLPIITLPRGEFDAIVGTPVEKIVVTSTTHIAPIEELGELHTIVGFPETDYVSSPTARKRIEEGHIKELGMNEFINTEMVLLLNRYRRSIARRI